jgi:hypothetical protein
VVQHLLLALLLFVSGRLWVADRLQGLAAATSCFISDSLSCTVEHKTSEFDNFRENSAFEILVALTARRMFAAMSYWMGILGHAGEN